jgi:hypothetical protein
MPDTVLALSGFGVVPYSARGLQQTLEPIDQAAVLRRTINGILVDMSSPQFQKYKSTITGNDHKPPSCDGLWPGRQIIVDCIAEMAYPNGGTPQRPVVDGSSYSEAGFVFYRPRLTMIVVAFAIQADEWGAQVGWHMDIEER